MKTITFNRTKLYKELWEKPMTQIAKDYKTNVYQLTKVCDELEIQIKQQELNQEQLARFIKWKNWATKHADRLNPVKQKIDSILNPVEKEESKLHLW